MKTCDLSNQTKEHSESTFQISQSYLKKSAAITNLLASMGGLKVLISQYGLLNANRRRIKQQNDSVNIHFVRNLDELLKFFCENNTDLTWSGVNNTLIDYVDSRTQISGIEINHLIQVAKVAKEHYH